MEEEKKQEKKDVCSKEIKDLVIARLKTIPPNVSLSIGEMGGFEIEDLVNHVQNGDDIGQMIIEEQLNYIRSLKDLSFNLE